MSPFRNDGGRYPKVTMLVSMLEIRRTKLEHPDSIHESRYELPRLPRYLYGGQGQRVT